MSVIEAILLGIVQGLTEFIPVSSSGHLILVSEFLNLENSSLTFDVALHGGTLIALFVVFWRDLIKLIKALFIKAPETQLAWLIIVATIPAAIVGFLLEDTAQGSFRSSKLVAVNLIIVAILMLLVERYAKNKKLEGNINKIQNKQGIFVGFAQALAVVPGVSRSGVTITAGLFAGIDRVVATRFSFLLGIPIIFGAVLKVLMANSESSVDRTILFVGVLTAFLSGLLAIKFLLRFLKSHKLNIFAYYRIALGLLVLFIAL